MKRVINGRRYDTKKAAKVGTFTGSNITMTLYRKRGGEYFIHSELTGAAAGSHITPRFIRPVSADDARKWAEHYLGEEQARAEFEPEGTCTLFVRISGAAKARLDRYCLEQGCNRYDFVEAAIWKLC